MILYFSGTGNSKYVAKRIGKEINDEVIDLFTRIKSNDTSKMTSDKPWIIVVPTYAWRIPHIIREWLEKTPLEGSKDIYFVMTCGGSIGNAGKYLQRLCSKKNLNYFGCAKVIMPENYIAMFSTPSDQEAIKIIDNAEYVIDDVIKSIKNKEIFKQPDLSLKDKLNSGIVNDIFYPVFVHAKKFYYTDACISCSKCAQVCPLSNIEMVNEKPVWSDVCTHCMACISYCPTNAIEYGKHTQGLNRYVCKKEVK